MEKPTTNKKNKIQCHILHHGKIVGMHVKKHHKKYIFGSALYGLFHFTFLHGFAFKLFAMKFLLSLFALLGIHNHSMMDSLAKMENICIDGQAIIDHQSCDKNFDTIQDAIYYLEYSIDPEFDTIYNAQYHNLIQPTLYSYCGDAINNRHLVNQKLLFKFIDDIEDPLRKTQLIKKLYEQQRKSSLHVDAQDDTTFCVKKYLTYTTLEQLQKLFLSQLSELNLLTYSALKDSPDSGKVNQFTLEKFSSWQEMDKANIAFDYEEEYFRNGSVQKLADIIANISLNTISNTLDDLYNDGIIDKNDKKDLQDKIVVEFIPSCDKVRGYHTILQYYNDDNDLTRTKLKKLKFDIPLCNSYQYIDLLALQMQKLFSHEVGHYIYYFKDSHPEDFTLMCRNNDKRTCHTNAFVSKYSQSSPEEDYAETFSRWFVNKIEPSSYAQRVFLGSKNYTPLGEKVHGAAQQEYNSSQLDEKNEYFDELYDTLNK